MPTSVNDLFTQPPGTPPASGGKPAVHGQPVEELFPAAKPKAGGAPVLSAVQKVATAAAQPARDWWTEFKKRSDSAITNIHQDLEQTYDPQSDTYKGGAGAGHLMLDALDALWSPVGAAVDVIGTKPLQAGVSAAGEKLAEHLPTRNTAPPKAGIDFSIRQEDVDQQVKDINGFLDTALQKAAGFAPLGEAGKLRGAADALSASDKRDFMQRAPTGSVAGGKSGAFGELSAAERKEFLSRSGQTRDSAAKGVENAFDELIVRNPEAANKVADQLAAVSPPAAKAAKLRIKMKSQAQMTAERALKEQQALGEQIAAQKMSDGPAGAEAPLPSDHNSYWGSLHAKLEDDYGMIADTKPQGVSSLQLIDHMIDHADEGYTKMVLQKIRRFVPDLNVRFTWGIPAMGDEYTQGVYLHGIPSKGESWLEKGERIEVRVNPRSTSTLVHEMVHAATTKFIKEFPEHPVVKELEKLMLLARDQWDHEAGWQGGRPYSFTDVHEFVAEAMSNPHFQEWLSRTKVSSVKQSFFTKLSQLVQRIFGIGSSEGKESHLFNQVMYKAETLMALQARARQQLSEEMSLAAQKSEAPRETSLEAAFSRAGSKSLAQNQFGLLEGKLKQYFNGFLRTFAPESLGPAAKTAGANVARAIAEEAQAASQHFHESFQRRRFWNQLAGREQQFWKEFESGKITTPAFQKPAEAYRQWTARLVEQDRKSGVQAYEPIDHYFPHLFKDPEGMAEWLEQYHGAGWTDPGFTLDRHFATYEQAIKAGFQPRFTNPEDVMLARQHASDVAEARIAMFKRLEEAGVAVKAEKGDKLPAGLGTKWSSPDGEKYWVQPQANAVLHNAFKTQSIWNAQGLGGDLFRGAMGLKNRLVPIKLMWSLFHPLHVMTIDNAAAMAREGELLLSGRSNPVTFAAKIAYAFTAGPLVAGAKIARGESPLLQAYKGKLVNITPEMRQSLQYMVEGGMIPDLNPQLKSQAVQKFTDALQARSVSAVWRLPDYAVSKFQGAVFDKWIPSLKIASYLKDVDAALKMDPTLFADEQARMQRFRALAKSVDNRYGEMAYNTLFWPKWVKDLGVANTLSMGWQLGFMREYGGGALDLGQAALGKGKGISGGQLHRPLFVAFYTTSALGYGGLLTWALTGKPPQSLQDYVYPQTGEVGPDGKPKRVSTMFYTREFESIAHHVRDEGLLEGAKDIAESKSSGLIGLVAEWATNVNAMHQEISRPGDPFLQRLEQKIKYTLTDLEPITVAQGAGQTARGKTLTALGFSPAPKYATETPTEGRISALYKRYNTKQETSYDSAVRSKESRDLRQAYESGDTNAFDKGLEAMQQKYQLTGTDVKRMVRDFARGRSQSEYEFSRLEWGQQQQVLKAASPEEREKLLPLVSRKHRADAELIE